MSENQDLVSVLRHTNSLLEEMSKKIASISMEVSLIRQDKGVKGLPIELDEFITLINKFDSNRTRFNWLTCKYWHKKPRKAPEELKLDQMQRIYELIEKPRAKENFAVELYKNKDKMTSEKSILELYPNSRQLMTILGIIGGFDKGMSMSERAGMPQEERIKRIIKLMPSFEIKEYRKTLYAVDDEKLKEYEQYNKFQEK